MIVRIIQFSTLILLFLASSCHHNQHIKTTSDSHWLDTVATPVHEVVCPDYLKAFIPDGYSLLDTASGNLNLDQYQDMILVLKNNKERLFDPRDTNYVETSRPVLILTGRADGHYTFQYRNDSVAYHVNWGGAFGDPYAGISIKNGYFSIENGIMGGHHWQHIITFKFNKEKSNWYLSKVGSVSYESNNDTSANAPALVKDYEKISTMKDFGLISFSAYKGKE